MESEKIILIFNNYRDKKQVDIEVPSDITANELFVGLNEAYKLGIDATDVKNCFLRAENPIALLRGNRTLKEYGLHNGSIINFIE